MSKLKTVFLLATTSIVVAVFMQDLYAQVGRQQGLLNPNVAAEKDLAGLPHFKPAIAKGLIEKRPFADMKELDAYLGQSVDDKQRAELYSKMFLPLNLNAASRDEILMIPGMGKRMLHEFLEYRPYTTLSQFRKEMGKYVDEKEVARLEQFIFVPMNPNSASDDAIGSIAGATAETVRVIKDHRPYKSIEQFEQSLGKAIGEKEAQRIARYFSWK